MQKVIGILLRDSEHEIIENEDPTKGLFASLAQVIAEERKRLEQNPQIKRINIYKIEKDGTRTLSHAIASVIKDGVMHIRG